MIRDLALFGLGGAFVYALDWYLFVRQMNRLPRLLALQRNRRG